MTAQQPEVVVVDDEAAVRTMLARVLRLADYCVSTHASGKAFLDSLETHPPDCVILDVHMPDLSGLEVHARMRAIRPDIPAIFITASDDLALDKLVHDAGGAALLRKPFPSAELLDIVAVAVAGKARPAS